MNIHFLSIALYGTGFCFLIICLSLKPHPSQMKVVRLIVHLEEDSEEFFRRVAAISQISTCHLCAWGPCMGVHRAMVLIGDAKQATSEGKSGTVETRLTGLAAKHGQSNSRRTSATFCVV